MTNKKYAVILFLVSILTILSFVYWKIEEYQYPIITITSFKEALPQLDRVTENTLVLFDIDDTLVSTVDAFGCYYLMPTLFKIRAAVKYPQLLLWKNIVHYYSVIWSQGAWQVLEPIAIQIINSLQQRGCTVLALSSMETDNFGIIDQFPTWRYKSLKELGIVMSQKFPNARFYDLPTYCNAYPELYNGIICCNQQPKGKVLTAFLEKFDLHPDAIIFFDDKKQNVISVAKACKQRCIPFHGFEYRGETWQTCRWHNERAKWQLDKLMCHDRFYSDKEYTEAMDKAKQLQVTSS